MGKFGVFILIVYLSELSNTDQIYASIFPTSMLYSVEFHCTLF